MKSLEELKAIRDRALQNVSARGDNSEDIRVVVGMATCGIAAGARPVLSAFVDVCQFEPVVEVYVPGREKVTYVKMSAEKVPQVVTEHIVNGRPVQEFTIGAYTK